MKYFPFFLIFITCLVEAKDEFVTIEQKNYYLISSEEVSGFDFHHNKNGSLVTVIDTNEDGEVDLLRYTAYSEDGKAVIESSDYNLDGTIDVRWHVSDKYFEIWHLTSWHRIENGENSMYINTKKGAVPVIREDGQFKVTTHNKAFKSPSAGTAKSAAL